jgi:hypothetical protein
VPTLDVLDERERHHMTELRTGDDTGAAAGAQPSLLRRVDAVIRPGDGAEPGARSAAWAFGAYIVVALPTLLWLGSYRWFFGDEWSFIADRNISLDGLFRPHNQHWSTFPVLIYRGLYSLFGLHTYWPYQLVVILLHLLGAVLLRMVMRRAHVLPWLATIVAGIYVLFGPGEDNILWAFQIGFAGAVALGLTQLMLADHDGPIDRRDWLGLLAGLVCLMSSGQSLGLIAAVGLSCLLRRRWWAAAFHTVPLGVAYVIWYLATGVQSVVHVDDRPFGFGEYLRWMRDAVEGLFAGLGHFTPLAVMAATVLVAGTVVAATREGTAAFLRRASVPLALVIAAVLSMSVAAPSRFALGEGGAKAGRYVGVLVAMTLPALAVACDALVRWRRWTVPVVAITLLVPIPFNIVAFGDDPVLTPATFRGIRNYVTNLPDQPLVQRAPPWVVPNRSLLGEPDMSVGWLLQAKANGELPEPTEPLHPLVAQLLPIQLGVAQVSDGTADGLTCADHQEPVSLDPSVGDRWYFDTPTQIAGRVKNGGTTLWLLYGRTGVEILLPDLHLVAGPAPGRDSFRLCR